MKKLGVILTLLFLVSGCGTLRVNPKSCKTNAVWGFDPDENVLEIKSKKEFIVFDDHDVRLRDLLEEQGIKCEEVKKLRMVFKTSWFFMREVSLKIVKN